MIHSVRNLKFTYYAFDGDISFFASKPYSRQPLQNAFEIQSFIEGYTIQISLFKKTLKKDYGVIPINSTPRIQFIGELLEFDYSELSESESTVVFKGDLKILSDIKQKTFLGSIKKIDDTILLKANFSLNPSEFEFEKVLNCSTSFNSTKAINVEIMVQLRA